MTKIIGVIGLGSIGMRHAKNLLAMGHKVCAYDPIMFQEAIDIPFLNIEDMPSHVDAVVIASPTDTHLKEMLSAVRYSEVLVEKPIAHGEAGNVGAVLDLARASGRLIFTANNLRFHSCVKKAKEWLDAGLIGTPIWARFTVSQLNKKPYKEDVVLNWCAHELDLARYLLGDAMVVSSIGTHDLVDITIQHLGNGCQTTVHADYLTEPEVRTFIIIGTKGQVGGDLVERGIYLYETDKERSYNEEFSDSWDQNYIEEMQAFIDAIDGKPSPLLATGADGLAALELILRAKQLAGIE